MALEFELTKQYPYGVEQVIAKFSHEKDALDFMNDKVDRDHKTKVESTYRLYHYGDCIREIESLKHEESSSSASEDKGRRFNPTPLATTPRPQGSVPYQQKDDDDEDDTV